MKHLPIVRKTAVKDREYARFLSVKAFPQAVTFVG